MPNERKTLEELRLGIEGLEEDLVRLKDTAVGKDDGIEAELENLEFMLQDAKLLWLTVVITESDPGAQAIDRTQSKILDVQKSVRRYLEMMAAG